MGGRKKRIFIFVIVVVLAVVAYYTCRLFPLAKELYDGFNATSG